MQSTAHVHHPSAAARERVAGAEPAAFWLREIASLPRCQTLYVSGDYRVEVARRAQAPHLMNEIGRLRELSFRGVGEGTGEARDIDAFDDWYTQLFVWHSGRREVLGAYRLCMTDVVQRDHGAGGLYTKSLFDYDASFLDELGPALELGRSFVRSEMQGAGRVLALLWRGIAHLVAARPRYRTLFGPVSVSSNYTPESRRLIMESLSQGRYRHSLSASVRALRPVEEARAAGPEGDEAIGALSRRVAQLEADRKGVPTLVKEYVKLGGKFLSFSIDPDFADAMDGLVAVDLDRTNPRLLSLYMGEANYQKFCRSRGPLRDRPSVPTASP